MLIAQPTAAEFYELVERLNSLDALKCFGAKVSVPRENEATVAIDHIKDFHLGGIESRVVNGMILMGLLDCAMCTAALTRLAGQRGATVDISIQFIKPVISESVTAFGKVVSRSRDLLFCEAWVVDARGRPRVEAKGLVQAI